jgi:hypothetical protein
VNPLTCVVVSSLISAVVSAPTWVVVSAATCAGDRALISVAERLAIDDVVSCWICAAVNVEIADRMTRQSLKNTVAAH